MTTNSDFDRHAAAFLADGPTELADRVLDAALHEVHQTRQRRRWTTPWRNSLMSLRLSAGIAMAIVAVAGLAAFNLIGGTGPAPTATPSPAATTAPAACGHELVQGLYLTAGCTYRTSNLPPILSISTEGGWLDTFQTTSALDFVAISGPAQNAGLRLRPLRTVLADPCQMGSSDRRSSTPGTARAYLDWLGGFIAEPTHAVEAEMFGLRGWRFDLNGDGKQTFDPEDPCAFVSLAEPAVDARTGSAETVGFGRTETVRVYVLDVSGGVLLAMLSTTGAEGSEAAADSFLAGIHAEP